MSAPSYARHARAYVKRLGLCATSSSRTRFRDTYWMEYIWTIHNTFGLSNAGHAVIFSSSVADLPASSLDRGG